MKNAPTHIIASRESSWLNCALLQVLLDIGAGIGYYSLAAAARGHQVIAAELSPTSTASFEASIRYTGFGKAITFHNVSPCQPAFTAWIDIGYDL